MDPGKVLIFSDKNGPFDIINSDCPCYKYETQELEEGHDDHHFIFVATSKERKKKKTFEPKTMKWSEDRKKES